MKILRVIVDKLPISCDECFAYDHYDGPMCGLVQYTRPDFDPYIWACDSKTERHPECPLALAQLCPGCPLRVEHDEEAS